MSKFKGVTVVTVPPRSESYSPVNYPWQCCSVSSLGIMVGLFTIGLGPGRTSFHPDDFTYWGAAYWMGAVFLVTGIFSAVATCFRSYILMGFAVFMNLISSIVAVVGIMLYGMDLQDSYPIWLCDRSSSSVRDYSSSDNCMYVVYYFQRLLVGMDITLIVTTALQLFVNVTLAVLALQGLCFWMKNQGDKDAEIHKPLLKEVLMTSPGA